MTFPFLSKLQEGAKTEELPGEPVGDREDAVGTWGPSYPSLEAGGEGLLSATEEIGDIQKDRLGE